VLRVYFRGVCGVDADDPIKVTVTKGMVQAKFGKIERVVSDQGSSHLRGDDA
jgi:hypothetical protein